MTKIYKIQDQVLSVELKSNKSLPNAYTDMMTYKTFVNGQEYMDIVVYQTHYRVSTHKSEAMAELKDKVENVINNYNRGNGNVDSKLLSLLKGQ